MALIDHDAMMMRVQVFKAINEHQRPITDILIELLLVEVDLGVIMQMADAIKILLDPASNMQSLEAMSRTNSEFFAKIRNHTVPHADSFASELYKDGIRKLFRPLIELDQRENSESSLPSPCIHLTNPSFSLRYDSIRNNASFAFARYPLLFRPIARTENKIPSDARKHCLAHRETLDLLGKASQALSTKVLPHMYRITRPIL